MLSVTDAIQRRISTRAFLPAPLPRALVHEILEVARFAPSRGNLQPWKVIVLAGAAAQEVKDLALKIMGDDPTRSQQGDRPMYPAKLWAPYRTRRFKVGEDMYAKMGIALAAEERGVQGGKQEAWMRIREALHGHFKLEPQEMIYCGMALGHADKSAPVGEFATFLGF